MNQPQVAKNTASSILNSEPQYYQKMYATPSDTNIGGSRMADKKAELEQHLNQQLISGRISVISEVRYFGICGYAASYRNS